MFGNGGKGRGIVSMTDREREKRLEPLRVVESYWHDLATTRGEVPLRSEIDPRSIENALEYAFLAERIAPGLAKLRVAGAHLNDLMGMETSGMPLSTLFTPAARDVLADAVTRVFAEGVMVKIRLTGEEGFGRNGLQGDLLLLPLRSDMGDMTRMIGALVTTGRIGRTPRRFDIESVSVQAATLTRTTPDAETAPTRTAPETPPVPGLAEEAAPFEATPSSDAKRPPYLRLIVSND
ncbi:MAG: diguanylate cyclase [Pelagibaca sp.]|nr:diguanylate cyclase [Pelagibaca sp.]